MERIHVIHEDYDHFQNRKKKDLMFTLKWVLPILFLLFNWFFYSMAPKEKAAEFLPLILIPIIWLGISVYLTFFRK